MAVSFFDERIVNNKPTLPQKKIIKLMKKGWVIVNIYFNSLNKDYVWLCKLNRPRKRVQLKTFYSLVDKILIVQSDYIIGSVCYSEFVLTIEGIESVKKKGIEKR